MTCFIIKIIFDDGMIIQKMKVLKYYKIFILDNLHNDIRSDKDE